MRNYQNRVLLGLALLSSVSMAHAENWVGVGGGIYLDTNSIKRNGDISNFDTRVNGGSTDNENADCKQGLILLGDGKAYSVAQYSTASPVYKTYTLACKKTWYEFWK